MAKQVSKTVFYIIAPFVILLWGSTFASTKILLRDFSPEFIMLMRFLVAWLSLMIAHPHWHMPNSWKDELLFFAAAMTGCVLYFWTENTALQYLDTITVGLLVAINPLLTMWISMLCGNSEKAKWTHWVGSLTSFVGVVLLSFNGEIKLEGEPLGYILSLTAALMWAIYSNIIRKIGEKNFSTIFTTRRIYFYSIFIMIVYLTLKQDELPWTAIAKPINLINILYLGIFASSLAFVFWAMIIKKIGILTANNFLYLAPIFIVSIGSIFMGESITTWTICGAFFVFGGLYISERK